MPAKNRTVYKLQIDNPCAQDWDTMEPREQGRFCTNCQKDVIDFTHSPDAEIIRKIQETNGHLCGRFLQYQMNRSLLPIDQSRSGLGLYKFLAGLFLASGLSNGHVKGETIKPQVVVNAMFDAEKTKATDHDASGPTKTGRTIEGRVTNIETGEPLPGIIIFLKDVGVRTVTDSLGNYSIMVPDTINDDSLIMRVAQIGYDHKDIVIDTHTLPLKIDVALNELERVIIQGGIMAPVMKQSKVQQLRNRIWRWADWY